MQEIRNIVLLGAGNVATQLGVALHEAGLDIRQVYSRTWSSAEKLASRLMAAPANDIHDIDPGADLYVVAISDDALVDVVSKLNAGEQFVVHTSGSVSMEALEPFAGRYGVIYPVQTFSATRKVDFSSVPVCIEANSLENLELLNLLASKISSDVRTVASDKRRLLHLAAVFACNFPNFMYSMAESVLRGANLDFDLLKPLIRETAEKVQSVSPKEAQTGPAWRGDRKVMDAHLQLLQNKPGMQELYRQISIEIGNMKEQG